jgi:dCMP deaminase
VRLSRDEWALRIAEVTALRSTCLRRSVGCVLTDARGRVLATGYNGVAAGVAHCNEELTRQTIPSWHPNACPGATAPSGTELDACQAVHAEQNALLQCRDPDAIDTAYATTAPCVSCAKLLANTGCRRIVFSEPYAASAEAFWAGLKRAWEQLGTE